MDRRIERLEREFATFSTDVALIKAEQGHLREVVTAKFTEQSLATARIETSLALFQSATTDVTASPLGRSLRDDIITVTTQAAAAQAIAERVEKRLILGTGVLGVLVWMAGIFGPTVARIVFGLPM